jgi:hypothetical protein
MRDPLCEAALSNANGFERSGVVAALWLGAGERQFAHGGRPLALPGFALRCTDLLRLPKPTEVTMDGHRVASGFGVKQPRRLIECRQVHSRSIDPCFISGDRRRDLIPFAAQSGGDVHSTKLEQNKNDVKEYSEYPEIVLIA